MRRSAPWTPALAEIRRSREPDAQQAGRDERHGRPRRGADDPLARSVPPVAVRSTQRPATATRPGPSAVSAMRSSSRPVVCADPRSTASPRRIPPGACRRPTPARRRPEPLQAPTGAASRGRPRRRRSRRASSDRQVDRPRAADAREAQADQGRAGEGEQRQWRRGRLPPDCSTVTYTRRDPGSLQRGRPPARRATASGDAFERIGSLPIGIEPVAGTRHARARAHGALHCGGLWSERGVASQGSPGRGAGGGSARNSTGSRPLRAMIEQPERRPARDVGEQPLERHGCEWADVREQVGHRPRSVRRRALGGTIDGPLRTVAEGIDRKTDRDPVAR